MLRVVAGAAMSSKLQARVLGRPAFDDASLASSGAVRYLGEPWRRTAPGGGGEVAFAADLSAGEMLSRVPRGDPARVERLVRVLGVDPAWRLHRVSDGQRRRVQIAVGLAVPCQVLLMDEVTVDLDVYARIRLLAFLKEESELRGVTVLYATHILDAMGDWPTELLCVSGGRVRESFAPDSWHGNARIGDAERRDTDAERRDAGAERQTANAERRDADSPAEPLASVDPTAPADPCAGMLHEEADMALAALVRTWMLEDRERRRKEAKETPPPVVKQIFPTRHMAYYS